MAHLWLPENGVRAGGGAVTCIARYAPFAMMSVLISLLLTLRGIARSRAGLHFEVLALRHQLQVLQRSRPATTPPRARLAVAIIVPSRKLRPSISR